MDEPAPSALYGLLAEFDQPEDLIAGVGRARRLGYQRIDAFSPYPLEELPQAMDLSRTPIPRLTLAGAVCGGLAAYSMMVYASAWSYPVNIGGRPLYSWPSFIPITFELTILGAALAAFFGMLISNALPRPYHPVFNVPRFADASTDCFFLLIEAEDQKFDAAETRALLEDLPSGGVYEVTR